MVFKSSKSPAAQSAELDAGEYQEKSGCTTWPLDSSQLQSDNKFRGERCKLAKTDGHTHILHITHRHYTSFQDIKDLELSNRANT